VLLGLDAVLSDHGTGAHAGLSQASVEAQPGLDEGKVDKT
jgi:hypothetical protein